MVSRLSTHSVPSVTGASAPSVREARSGVRSRYEGALRLAVAMPSASAAAGISACRVIVLIEDPDNDHHVHHGNLTGCAPRAGYGCSGPRAGHFLTVM
jgi:hypothetical protein